MGREPSIVVFFMDGNRNAGADVIEKESDKKDDQQVDQGGIELDRNPRKLTKKNLQVYLPWILNKTSKRN